MYQDKTSYEYLYLFRDVMRSGSYHKAAKEIGSSVNSIAKKIEQMERDLGLTLFEAGSGGTAPTAAGLFLYDKLDSVLWNLDSIIQEAKGIPGESSMKLNLGLSETLPGSAYRKLIRRFTQTYPDVSITLSAPPWREMHRKLIDGRLDAALTYSIGLFDEPRLNRRPLLRSKPILYFSEHCSQVISPDSPENLSIESFRNCTFVCLDLEVAPVNMLKDLPFDPVRVIFTDSLKTLFLYVNAGLACTILSPAQTLMETAGIRSLELTELNYVLGMDLIWEKSMQNPALNLLLDCAEKVYPPVRMGEYSEAL